MVRYVPEQHGKIWDVGAAGVVINAGRVLFVRPTYGPGKGRWCLPGGFARHDELLDEAAVREVFEETGVRTAVLALIGLRTRYVPEGGAVFVFFRMRAVNGEPRPDGEEVDSVMYLTAAEIAALDDTQIFSLARNAALAALEDGQGLIQTACDAHDGRDYRAFLAR